MNFLESTVNSWIKKIIDAFFCHAAVESWRKFWFFQNIPELICHQSRKYHNEIIKTFYEIFWFLTNCNIPCNQLYHEQKKNKTNYKLFIVTAKYRHKK